MKQIDLDDLPPRIAQALASLVVDEELTLVQGGAVVARLRLEAPASLAPAIDDSPSEHDMKQVMEDFNAMIHDEF